MATKKKISPQAIIALKEALPLLYWKKEQLQDFLKLSLVNNQIITFLDWSATKRAASKELIDRMINRMDIYEEDLLNLLTAVNDFEDYDNLKFWDTDGSKRKAAKEAILNLRRFTKGHFDLKKEKTDSEKRKTEFEKKIIAHKSHKEELEKLYSNFKKIACNSNFQERGYQLEKFIQEIFNLFELETTTPYKIKGEQIDGAFILDGSTYLLEAKWKAQVNRSDLATFCYKVETKFKTALGLIISIEGVTTEAVSPHFKSIIIFDGVDMISVLEGLVTLPDLINRKKKKADETGEIYLNFYNLN
jgi:hypothetical protein